MARSGLQTENTALGDQRGVAGNYHQLGTVAQLRGDFVAAENWYTKALAIEQALGDQLRPAGGGEKLRRAQSACGSP